ncbi:MAG: serine--tRNA ligase, partial [SAR324 cluster bacterium]|nr:serine--tRNA ligase [SAR324 cluster bacterium]
MIDAKLLRETPQIIAASLKKRGSDIDLAPLQAMDVKRRELLVQAEALKGERNENSSKIGKKLVEGDERQALIDRTKEIGTKIKEFELQVNEIEAALEAALLPLPNILDDSTPEGKSEDDNPEVRKWGTPRVFDFEPKHHAEVGEALDILDAPRGVKLAQSRFTLVKGAGAQR